MSDAQNYLTYVKEPNKCRLIELINFSKLIATDDQVDTGNLLQRIKSANLLAFAYHDGDIVGVAALKKPASSYSQKVFRLADSSEPNRKYVFELGWLYTHPEHREKGICSSCVKKLLKAEPNKSIFATTANVGAGRILENFGFVLSGHPYPSSLNPDCQLRLYLFMPKKFGKEK